MVLVWFSGFYEVIMVLKGLNGFQGVSRVKRGLKGGFKRGLRWV